MGILTELSLRRVHAGGAERAYRLTIGGEDWTSEVNSISVDFDPNGGSGMQLQVKESLVGLEDARVKLTLGYGSKTLPYFIGSLQGPSELHRGVASAFGPVSLMTEQSLGEAVTYQGVSLSYFLSDLFIRAGYQNGLWEVMGGQSYTVEKLDFTEETRLAEAMKTATDPANFVVFDRPGYRRMAMPEPRPGATGKAKAHYTEANYPVDGFQTKETREGHYASVVVFRRNSDGSYAVRQETEVPNRGGSSANPPKNRIFYVPEFPGTASEAAQEAYEIASRLAYGELDFELAGIWINPELEPWDSVSVESVQRRGRNHAKRPGKWLQTYQCLLARPINLEVSKEKHHMSLSGGAMMVREIQLPDPIRLILRRAISSGLVATKRYPALKPNIGLRPDIGLKPDVSHT